MTTAISPNATPPGNPIAIPCSPESFHGSLTMAPLSSNFLIAITLRRSFHSSLSCARRLPILLLALPESNRNCRIPSDLKKTSRSPFVQIASRVFLIRQTVSGEHSNECNARGSIASLPILASSSDADSRSVKLPESSFWRRLETWSRVDGCD